MPEDLPERISMKLQGRITQFDATKRAGIVEDMSGQAHIIEPSSFRRTTVLRQGDTVHFNSFNLSAGAVARDIEPELAHVFEKFQADLPR
jgi:hypothetical protein